MTRAEKERLYSYYQRDVKELTLNELDDYADLLHKILEEHDNIK